ncbi:MAG: c-type cytochrome [Planctomycetes bacterium]|nr:c-type cytochrome [Planctomycetota bacterium]
MTPNQPPLTSHEYDGIQEYDNPTPGWWHAIFVGSVLFSAVYFVFWDHSDLSWSIHDTWKKAQVAEYKRIFGKMGDLKPDQATILSMMGKPDMMAIAQSTFTLNCAQCHAKDGGGINGVNLTDDHYKNVKTIEDLYKTITNGANNGAMPSWKSAFSDNERVLLAAYVASLRGTKPASPKAPEGEQIPPWPKAQ